MELFFIYSYPLVSIISIAGYFPQIRNLILTDKIPTVMSMPSWIMWSISAGMTFGYGVCHLHDRLFCLVSGTSFGLILTTTALLAFRLYGSRIRVSYRPDSY